MAYIKVAVRYDERTNTHYYRNFEIVNECPVCGDYFEGELVQQIDKSYIDYEQLTDEVFDYDYFDVEVFNEDEYFSDIVANIECERKEYLEIKHIAVLKKP